MSSSPPQSVAMIPTRIIPALFVLLAISRVISAFTVDHLIGDARISHSGPTNSLYGHEQFADEHPRDKRALGFGANQFTGGNQFNNNNNNNNFGGLLWSSEAPDGYLKNWLVSEHNQYRKMVPATDMRMLYWSDELAASAQRHANTCDFRHSRNRINIGENIWAAPYTNYSDAVSRWWNEVNNPHCGCNHAYKHCCGHYIQVVWAKTNLMGCGYARCRDVLGVLGMGMRAVLVCHYNPQGNKIPAFKWANNNSQRCSECPPDAPACHEGLCYMPLNHQTAGGNGTATASALPKDNKPGTKTDKALEKNTVVDRK